MDVNKEQPLSPMDIDAIGEILNISMGSAATSASNLLSQKVNITTPKVEVIPTSDLQFKAMEPAIGVEINYSAGLSGRNLMILKESDVRIIVGILLQTELTEEDFVLDDMSLGAIGEVMNQMMGGSATALSQFLNTSINITPPNTFAIDNENEFKNKFFKDNELIVACHFNLMIGDLVNSEFISLIPVELSKRMLSAFQFDTSAEAEEPAAAQNEPAPAAEPEPQPVNTVQAQNPKPEPEPQAKPDYVAYRAQFQSFDDQEAPSHPVPSHPKQPGNLGMMMGVPLQITVEIGRTKKKIREIMSLTPGTVIELDKQTDSQVDIYVNGQPTFQGDVVVVNDSYGVRITKILDNVVSK